MLKDNRIMLSRLLLLVDICTIIISYLIAYYLRFYCHFIRVSQEIYYPLGKYATYLLVLVPPYLLIYTIFQEYSLKPEPRTWLKYGKLVLSNVIVIVCFLAMLYSLKEYNVSRIFIVLFLVINIVLSIGTRMLYSHLIKASHRIKS